MPNYDLGLLITLNIGLALIGLLFTALMAWVLVKQQLRSQEIMLNVARIAERIDARLRRDFPDIGGELGD
jgi:hypothetical protein